MVLSVAIGLLLLLEEALLLVVSCCFSPPLSGFSAERGVPEEGCSLPAAMRRSFARLFWNQFLTLDGFMPSCSPVCLMRSDEGNLSFSYIFSNTTTWSAVARLRSTGRFLFLACRPVLLVLWGVKRMPSSSSSSLSSWVPPSPSSLSPSS